MTSASKPQTADDAFVDDLAPGTSLLHGQYTVKKYLNAGGFGITYLAADSLDRTIVIKECFPSAFCRRSNLLVQTRSRVFENELGTIVQLFLKEARSLAKLSHPNIVGVHQVFEGNNTAYMALDFIQGEDLFNLIERRDPRLSPATIQSLLRKLLDAIGAVHAAGLLHRDISPDNIIITDALEPVLIDFGAAREQATRKTRALSALRIVKDGYSPQEFYVAGSIQGPASDLYSLAATFYHVITGDLPPDSQTRIAAQVEGRPDPYIPLGSRTQEFDAAFCDALDRAIAILPRSRFQSAQDWLDAIAGRPVPAAAGPMPSAAVARVSVPVPPRISAPLMPRSFDPGPMPKATTKKNGTRRHLPLLAAGVAAAIALTGGALLVLPLSGIGTPPVASARNDAGSPEDGAVDEDGGKAAAAEAFRTAMTGASTPTVSAPSPAAETKPAEAYSPAPVILSRDGLAGIGVVTSGWTIELPFSTIAADNLTLASVTGPAAAALVPGQRIIAVNREPVSSLADVTRISEAAVGNADSGQVSVVLTLDGGDAGGSSEQTITIDVVPYIAFPNGLSFRSYRVADGWQTKIATVPQVNGLAVKTGDVLVALMPGREPIAHVDSLRRLVLRDASVGKTSFSLAIRRDGLMWVQEISVEASAG